MRAFIYESSFGSFDPDDRPRENSRDMIGNADYPKRIFRRVPVDRPGRIDFDVHQCALDLNSPLMLSDTSRALGIMAIVI